MAKIDVINNTLYGSMTQNGMFLQSDTSPNTNMTLRNNIINETSASGGDECLSIVSPITQVDDFNNNIFFDAGTNFFEFNGTVGATIAVW